MLRKSKFQYLDVANRLSTDLGDRHPQAEKSTVKSKQHGYAGTEAAKRLLANLRQTHLEMCEFNRELDKIAARVEHDLQQQRLRQMGRSHVSFVTESNKVVG
jgi:predicted GNAT family acetyltransferase